MSDEHESSLIRRHVIFHGHVQGVCFRMITHELAYGFDVVGFVRNLPDGTVELEAQGDAAEVERFVAAINSKFESNIRRMDATEATIKDGDNDFQITY